MRAHSQSHTRPDLLTAPILHSDDLWDDHPNDVQHS
jgi:hypothetical protein